MIKLGHNRCCQTAIIILCLTSFCLTCAVEKIFASLAKEDLYRAIDTARSFTADAPRASASLAVARAVLETKN